MKKLALFSLPFVTAGLLSGCGGEELFDEPAADFESCIVGSWTRTKTATLSDIEYARNYTFFSDGTMEYDERSEVPFWFAAIATLEGTYDGEYPGRYGIKYQTGAWDYQDGIFYIDIQHTQYKQGLSEREVVDYVQANTPRGVPIESSPEDTDLDGYTTHCDDEYFKTGVFKKIEENPLVYQGFRVSNYWGDDSPKETTYTLFPDGTGEYRYNNQPAKSLEYYYEGNVMYIDREDSQSTRDFIDHGHTLVPFNSDYYSRK